MKATLIKIGNSQGIRIPKPILEQCDLQGEVELEVHDRQLVIRGTHRSRQNWEQAFQKMAAFGDDALFDPEIGSQTDWDDAEWEWK